MQTDSRSIRSGLVNGAVATRTFSRKISASSGRVAPLTTEVLNTPARQQRGLLATAKEITPIVKKSIAPRSKLLHSPKNGFANPKQQQQPRSSPVLSRHRTLLTSPTSGIPKSASVPTNLSLSSVAAGGILKRSSSLLLNGPTNSSTSVTKSKPSGLRSLLLFGKGRRKGGTENNGKSVIGGTVGTAVRPKCVSFSSDTSFERERRGAGRPCSPAKAALHEAKLYRKGVLLAITCCADRNGDSSSANDTIVRGASPSELRSAAESALSSSKFLRFQHSGGCCGLGESEPGLSSESTSATTTTGPGEALGGPTALLGAAHDADDELVKKIISLATAGSGPGRPAASVNRIDVNAFDASGRTAISYLAGNGSALMLEACLSLPSADANLPDNEGNTPLHFAAQAGQTECVNILLQRCQSIEVDARNTLGFTPLMKAALQGRTKCAKILLFAGANPTLRDHGRGFRAEQWARFCGRYVCAEVIERFARHRLLEKTASCRWGSEPELAAQVLQGKLVPMMQSSHQSSSPPSSGSFRSRIRRVFRTTSGSGATGDKHHQAFSLVSQLTSAALCASSPVLPKPDDNQPLVKSLLRPLSVPTLRITLVSTGEHVAGDASQASDKLAQLADSFAENEMDASPLISVSRPPRTKKKSK